MRESLNEDENDSAVVLIELRLKNPQEVLYKSNNLFLPFSIFIKMKIKDCGYKRIFILELKISRSMTRKSN